MFKFVFLAALDMQGLCPLRINKGEPLLEVSEFQTAKQLDFCPILMVFKCCCNKVKDIPKFVLSFPNETPNFSPWGRILGKLAGRKLVLSKAW